MHAHLPSDPRSGRNPVALGALREHVHHDRERRWQDDSRAESLEQAHRDQEASAGRESRAERGRREHAQAQHQDPPAPEQVGGPATEEQEAAEGDPVSGNDPLQVRFGEVKVAADGRQRDVDDGEVDDGHEECDGQCGERAPAVNLGNRLGVHVPSLNGIVTAGKPAAVFRG
jgi:hypothetical protein